MKEHFVTYEEALIFKEKGFNEPCFGYYFRGNLFYNAAPYVYNGDDYFVTLGMQSCTQVMKSHNDVCLAPLKQQAYSFDNSKNITCKKGDVITIKMV